MREVLIEETNFDKKQTAFEDEHSKVILENDELQEELDHYGMEKEEFERTA